MLTDMEMEETRANLENIREECRTFANFVKRAWRILEPETPLLWSWHLDAMCMCLQAISLGKITPRLIINVSPGSSKSMIVSVLWQAWVWGPLDQKGKRFLSTSFDIKNVARDTEKTRDLIESDWYKELWPEVVIKRRASTNFSNTLRGGRVGVAFIALLGKRADVLLVDDPHSLDGAESENDRTKAVRRFVEGGRSRVNDRINSAIVIVMQRLHMDDLTGAILARSDLGYLHLMIPMEFEPDRKCVIRVGPRPPEGANDNRPIFWQDPRKKPGELMDPRRFPASEVETEKVSEYSWNGQYMQRPAPREGGLFKVDKIGIIEFSPGGGRACRGWDLAGTKRKTSAWTVGLLLRRLDSGQLIIEDVKRERKDPFGVKQMAQGAAIDDGLRVLQSLPKDPGQAGVAQAQDWAANVLDGHNFKFTPETGEKETRALGIASAILAGLVSMVRAPWNAPLIEELRNFPAAKYKDQVDALSRAYSELVVKKGDGAGGMPQTITVEIGKREPQNDADVPHPELAWMQN